MHRGADDQGKERGALVETFLARCAGKPLRVVARESGLAFSTIGRMRRGEPWEYSFVVRQKMRRYLGLLSPDEQEDLRRQECPPAPQGWQCPACKKIYAPWVETCRRCD